jgi:hypothetical protein
LSLIGRALVVITVAMMVVQSSATDRPSTKELLQQADAASAAGKLEQAESIACAASSRDQKSKEAQEKCDQFRQVAQAQRNADHKHVRDGAADFVMKKFAAAETEFQAIKSTSFSSVKKEWLDKIALARAQADQEQQKKDQERQLAEEAARKQAAEADSAMHANLDRGMAAYEKNDFATARKLLAAISGTYREQAQKYMANIDQYNRAMREGANFEKAGEYKSALAAYQRAVAVKSNGPLNPKDKIANLQQVIAQSEEAQKEGVVAGPSPQDQVLLSALEQYYQGDYSLAEDRLAAYAGTSAKLNALAHFYLGASRLGRYYLAVDAAEKDKLWHAAIADLQLAKHTPEFVAPRSVVSPKVMEVYETSVP